MPEAMTKTKNNKAAKRRQRNKRRLRQSLAAATTTSILGNPKGTSPPAPTTASSGEISYARAMQLWRQMYENAVQWQQEHQLNFWRQRAEHLQKENEALKRRRELESWADEYETSTDEEEEELKEKSDLCGYFENGKSEVNVSHQTGAEETTQDEIDAGYLEFMATTHKHREELKLRRQREVEETEATA